MPAVSPDENAAAARGIAIVKLSSMGDVLHALPAVHALKQQRPDHRLTWVVQSEILPLLAPLTWLGEVIPFERRAGWRGVSTLRAALSRRRPDLALDLQGNWKSALVSRLSGARERWGPHRRDAREWGSDLVLHRTATPTREPHAIDRNLHVVSDLFGLERPPNAIPWSSILAITPAERERGRERLEKLGVPTSKPLVVVHVGRRDDPRAWPLEPTEELIRRGPAELGVHVLALGGPLERSEFDQLRQPKGPDRATSWLAQAESLRDLLGLYAALAERPAVLVSGDNGRLHLAVAGGLRVVALWGPFGVDRSGPYGAGHARLTAPSELPCRPCSKRTCRLSAGPRCTREVTVDAVLASLATALGP